MSEDITTLPIEVSLLDGILEKIPALVVEIHNKKAEGDKQEVKTLIEKFRAEDTVVLTLSLYNEALQLRENLICFLRTSEEHKNTIPHENRIRIIDSWETLYILDTWAKTGVKTFTAAELAREIAEEATGEEWEDLDISGAKSVILMLEQIPFQDKLNSNRALCRKFMLCRSMLNLLHCRRYDN